MSWQWQLASAAIFGFVFVVGFVLIRGIMAMFKHLHSETKCDSHAAPERRWWAKVMLSQIGTVLAMLGVSMTLQGLGYHRVGSAIGFSIWPATFVFLWLGRRARKAVDAAFEREEYELRASEGQSQLDSYFSDEVDRVAGIDPSSACVGVSGDGEELKAGSMPYLERGKLVVPKSFKGKIGSITIVDTRDVPPTKNN